MLGRRHGDDKQTLPSRLRSVCKIVLLCRGFGPTQQMEENIGHCTVSWNESSDSPRTLGIGFNVNLWYYSCNGAGILDTRPILY